MLRSSFVLALLLPAAVALAQTPPGPPAPPPRAEADRPDQDDGWDADDEEVLEGDEHGVRVRWKNGKWRAHSRDKDDRVSVGGSVEVGQGEVVNDAVAVGGSVTVRGHVRGDAVAVGGSIALEPGAVVDGDTVAIGGQLEVAQGAEVHGNRVHVGGGLGDLIAGLATGTIKSGQIIPWAVLATVLSVLKIVLLLAVALLILAFAPTHVDRVVDVMVARPVASLGAGFALLLATVPLIILLAITILGIPLIPVAGVFIAATFMMGFTAVCMWVGRRLPLMQARKGPFTTLLLGAAVVLVLSLVPALGDLALFVVGLIGAGATLLARFGRTQAPPPSPTGLVAAAG